MFDSDASRRRGQSGHSNRRAGGGNSGDDPGAPLNDGGEPANMMRVEPLEITDLIAHPHANRADAAARLRASGQERAARMVEALPAVDGVLDETPRRLLLRRIHAEIQRLGEELQLPRRVAEDIGEISSRHRVARVIDVGCGAMAVILGPLTLLRPLACLAAPLLVAAATHDPAAALLTAFLAACQLAVEPVAGRRISC